MLRRFSVSVDTHHIGRDAFGALFLAVTLENSSALPLPIEKKEAHFSFLQSTTVTSSGDSLAWRLFAQTAILRDLGVQHGDGRPKGAKTSRCVFEIGKAEAKRRLRHQILREFYGKFTFPKGQNDERPYKKGESGFKPTLIEASSEQNEGSLTSVW
jgi:hypothetical protein